MTDMMLGTRGASTDRQLLYEVGNLDIDLQIVRESEDSDFTLHGQILAGELDEDAGANGPAAPERVAVDKAPSADDGTESDRTESDRTESDDAGSDDVKASLIGIELRLGAGENERRGLTDELGRFRFSEVASGSYPLHILINGQDILVDSIDVSSPHG